MKKRIILKDRFWFDYAAVAICLGIVAVTLVIGLGDYGIQQVPAPYSCRHMDQLMRCKVSLPDDNVLELTGHPWEITDRMFELRAQWRRSARIHLVFEVDNGVEL